MRALVTVLAGGLLGFALNQAFAVVTASPAVGRSELSVVDASGVVRARVWVDEKNEVRLGLFDEDGVRRAGISVVQRTPAVFLQDAEEGPKLAIFKSPNEPPRILASSDGTKVTSAVFFVPNPANESSGVAAAAEAPLLEVKAHEFRAAGGSSVADYVTYRVRVRNASLVAKLVAVHAKCLDDAGFMLGEDYCDEKRLEPGEEAWFTDQAFVDKGCGGKVRSIEARAIDRS